MTEDAWKVRAFVQDSLYGHENPTRAQRSDPDAAQGVLQNDTSQERKTGAGGQETGMNRGTGQAARLSV